MKYVLIYWALGGPAVQGVFESEAFCQALANETSESAAVRFCAEINLDTLVTDMIEWSPELNNRLKVL